MRKSFTNVLIGMDTRRSINTAVRDDEKRIEPEYRQMLYYLGSDIVAKYILKRSLNKLNSKKNKTKFKLHVKSNSNKGIYDHIIGRITFVETRPIGC